MIENLWQHILGQEIMTQIKQTFQNHIQYEERIKMLEMIGLQDLGSTRQKTIIRR